MDRLPQLRRATRFLTCDSGTVAKSIEAPSDPPESVPSLDVIFGEIQRGLDDQARLWDNLSHNARFVLTAASLLVAGFAAFPVARGESGAVGGWSAVPALLVYLWLAWSSLQGFRIRPFRTAPEPLGIREYLPEEATFTCRRIVAAMVQTYEDNRREIEQKACWVGRAQRMLVVEAVWLVIVSVVRAWF